VHPRGPGEWQTTTTCSRGCPIAIWPNGDCSPSRIFGSRLLQLDEPPCALKRIQGGVVGWGLTPPATRLGGATRSSRIALPRKLEKSIGRAPSPWLGDVYRPRQPNATDTRQQSTRAWALGLSESPVRISFSTDAGMVGHSCAWPPHPGEKRQQSQS